LTITIGMLPGLGLGLAVGLGLRLGLPKGTERFETYVFEAYFGANKTKNP
jgi:hypothetical protein